jgi:hypothetical protein
MSNQPAECNDGADKDAMDAGESAKLGKSKAWPGNDLHGFAGLAELEPLFSANTANPLPA